MAAVARQAASALATGQPQHQPAAQAARAAGPVSPAARPTTGATPAAVPGSPVTGSARPPYPPVPRPVSGARGAASVPSGPPAQQYRAPYTPNQPASTAKPEGAAGRQVLIVLAVVLALLVLLCAGVISFLVKQGQQNGNRSRSSGRLAPVAAVHTGTADSEPLAASYRLTRQAGVIPGWNRYEGRQTL
jgi:serine/threonine-protein kinase